MEKMPNNSENELPKDWTEDLKREVETENKESPVENTESSISEESSKFLDSLKKKLRDGETLTKEDLTFPEYFDGDIDLYDLLPSAENLILPKHLKGSLTLAFKSPKGLVLPESISRSLRLNGLTSIEGLVFPLDIDGDFELNSLTSASEGLLCPENVGGTVFLSSLKSPQGLTLPKVVNEHIGLSALTSVEGLVFPGYVKGKVFLESLSKRKKAKLREQYPDLDIV